MTGPSNVNSAGQAMKRMTIGILVLVVRPAPDRPRRANSVPVELQEAGGRRCPDP